MRKIVKGWIMYFSVKKSTKSHIRECSPLLYISSRVHELVAQAMRGKCMRQRAYNKVGSFVSSAVSYYHACEHSARKSRADSCTHCLHARIIGLAGVSGACALTKSGHFASLLLWGIDRVCEANAVGVAETGVEGGTRSVTDEEPLKRTAKINSIRAMLAP